jgi:predicted nucleotidyltransferase
MSVSITWRRLNDARRALVAGEVARVTAELAALGARRVVLFGSHARGDASDTSDVDLVVELPWDADAPAGARAAELLGRLAPRVVLDLVVYTPQEFEALQEKAPLLRAALAEGKVLHERAWSMSIYRSGKCVPHDGNPRVASPDRRQHSSGGANDGGRITGRTDGGVRGLAPQEEAHAGGSARRSAGASASGDARPRVGTDSPRHEG